MGSSQRFFKPKTFSKVVRPLTRSWFASLGGVWNVRMHDQKDKLSRIRNTQPSGRKRTLVSGLPLKSWFSLPSFSKVFRVQPMHPFYYLCPKFRTVPFSVDDDFFHCSASNGRAATTVNVSKISFHSLFWSVIQLTFFTLPFVLAHREVVA